MRRLLDRSRPFGKCLVLLLLGFFSGAQAQILQPGVVVMHQSWDSIKDASFAGGTKETQPFRFITVDGVTSAVVGSARIMDTNCNGYPGDSPEDRDTYWLTAQTSGNDVVLQQAAYANQQAGESMPGFCEANVTCFIDATRPRIGISRSTGAADVGRTASTLYGNYVIMARTHTVGAVLAFPVANPTQTFWQTTATFLVRYISLVGPSLPLFQFPPPVPTVYWSSATAAGATNAGGIWSLAIPASSTSVPAPTLMVDLSTGYDPWAFVFIGTGTVWVLDASPQFRTRGNLLLFSKSGGSWTFTRGIVVSSQLPAYALVSEYTIFNNPPIAIPFMTPRLFLANRQAVYSFDPASGVVDTVWVAPTAVMLTAHSATASWSGVVTWIRGLALTTYTASPFSVAPTPSSSATPPAGFSGFVADLLPANRFATGAIIVLGMVSRGGANLATNASSPATATGFGVFLDVVSGATATYDLSASAVWLDSRSDVGVQPCLATNGGVLGWPAFFTQPASGDPGDAASGPGGGLSALRGVAWVAAASPTNVHSETQLRAGEFTRSPVTACATVDGSFFYVAGGRPGTVQNFASDGVRLLQNGQTGTIVANVSGDSMSGSAPTSLQIFNRTLYGGSSRVGHQGIIQLSHAPGSLPASIGPRALREIRHLPLDYVGHPGMASPNGTTRPVPPSVAHVFWLRAADNALLGYVDVAGNEVHEYRRAPDATAYGSAYPLRWSYSRGFARDSFINPYGRAAPISMAGRVEPSGAYILYCVFAPVGPGISAIFTLMVDTGSWSLWRSYSTQPGTSGGFPVPGRQVRGIALAPWTYTSGIEAAATPAPSKAPIASLSPLPSPSVVPSVGMTAAPPVGESPAPAPSSVTSALSSATSSAIISAQPFVSPRPAASGQTSLEPTATRTTSSVALPSQPAAGGGSSGGTSPNSTSPSAASAGVASLCAPLAARSASRAFLDGVAVAAAGGSSSSSGRNGTSSSSSSCSGSGNSSTSSSSSGGNSPSSSTSTSSTCSGGSPAAAVLAALPRCAALPFALLGYGLNLTALSSSSESSPASAAWVQLRDRYGATEPSAAAGGADYSCWRPAVNGSALLTDYPAAAAAAAALDSDAVAPLGTLPGDVCALSCFKWDAVAPTVSSTLAGRSVGGASTSLPADAALAPKKIALGPLAWLCDTDGAWVPARMVQASGSSQLATPVPFSPVAMAALVALRSASSLSSSGADNSTYAFASVEPLCDSRIANGSALAATVAAAASDGTAGAWSAALSGTFARVGFPPRSGLPALPPPMCLPLAPRPQPAGSVAVCQGAAAIAAPPAPLLPWVSALPALSAWDSDSPDAAQQAADVTSLADAPAGAYAPLLVATIPVSAVGRNTTAGSCVLVSDSRIPRALLASINESVYAASPASFVLTALPAAPLLVETRATQQSGALPMRLDTAAALAAAASRLQALFGGVPGNRFDAASLSLCEADVTVHLLIAVTGGPSSSVQAISAAVSSAAAFAAIDGSQSRVGIAAVPGIFRFVSAPALPLWRGASLQYSSAAAAGSGGSGSSDAPLVYSQCARAVGLVQPPLLLSQSQTAAVSSANASDGGGSANAAASSNSTLVSGAVGAWADALPSANSLTSDAAAKRLVVSELLRPAPFAVTLLDPPLPSEVVTIACSVSTGRVPHLAVAPASYRLAASDFPSSSSPAAAAGVTRTFTVFVRSLQPTLNSSLLDESLPTVGQEALTCTVRGQISDGSGQQPAYRASSAPIAAEVLYLRPAPPLLLDSIVELRLGGGSNVTMLRAAWSGTEPATFPLAEVLTSSRASFAAAAGEFDAMAAAAEAELRDRVARSNPLVVAARAGTLQSRLSDLAVATSLSAAGTSAIRSDFSFSLLVTGAANVTLVAQAAFASLGSGGGRRLQSASSGSSGLASITRGPFMWGMQVRIGAAPCTVQWVSADGMLARVTTPATADLCPALARALASGQPTGRDCGFQPITLTLPGAPAAEAIAAMAAAPLGTQLGASTTGLSVRLTCPPACPGVGSGLVPVPAAASSTDATALSLGLATAADVAAAALSGSGVPASPIRASYASFGGIYYSERCTDTGLYEDPASGACANASDPRSRRCAYGAGDLCQMCPAHSVCPGGFRAYPLPGFWSSSIRSTAVLSCPAPAGRCTGYSVSLGGVACGEGYRQGSVLCLACAQGYYQAVDTTCQLCPPTLTIADIVVPIAKFAGGMLAVAGAMFVAVVAATKRNGGTLSGGARRTLQFTLSTFAVLQIFVSVGRAASPGLPPFMRDFIAGISVFVFDFPSIPAACLASPESRWRGVVLQFVLVIVAEAVLVALHINCRRVCGCDACGAPRLARAAHATHAAALKAARKSVAASAAGTKKLRAGAGAAKTSAAATVSDKLALPIPAEDGKADARHFGGIELTSTATTSTTDVDDPTAPHAVPAGKASPARKIGGGVGGMTNKQQMEALARQRAADALADRLGTHSSGGSSKAGGNSGGSRVPAILDSSKRLLRRSLWTLLFLLFATLTVSTISMMDCVTVTVPLRAYLTYDRDPLTESDSLAKAGISAAALTAAIDGCGADPLAPACVGDGASASTSPSVLLDSSISVRVLSSDPFQVCGEGSHRTPAALAIICLIFYVLGFPLASGLAVYRRGGQLVRKSAFGPAWELAVQQDRARQDALVAAARSAPHKALRRVLRLVCCTGRRYTGLPSASLQSRTGRVLHCLQLDCLVHLFDRSSRGTAAADIDLHLAANPLASNGRPGSLSLATMSRRSTHVNPLRPTLPSAVLADAGDGGAADGSSSPFAVVNGSDSAAAARIAAAKAAALEQTLTLARLPLPPLLVERLRQESAEWVRRVERRGQSRSTGKQVSGSDGGKQPATTQLVCWGEAAKARGLSLAVDMPADERLRIDFSPADAAAQAATLATLRLPPGRVITAGEIFDAAPPVAQDAALAPFFTADFRASSWWFKHLDLALLFVLDVLLVVYRQPSPGGAAARAALTVLALSGMLCYYVAKKPYRPEVSYNAPVRAYSLLLSAFVAGLNFACFQASQAAAAATAAGQSSQDEPLGVLLLSWLTFVAAVGLLATLFVSFWLALLRGAASEQRALQAAVDRRAKERIFVTPKANVAATLAVPAWQDAAGGGGESGAAAAGADDNQAGWWPHGGSADSSSAGWGEGDGRQGFGPEGTHTGEGWTAGSDAASGYDQHAWAGASGAAGGVADAAFSHSNPLAGAATHRRGRRAGDATDSGKDGDAEADGWGSSANEFAPTAVAGSGTSAAAVGATFTGGGRVAAARAAFSRLSTNGSPSTPVSVPVPEALATYKRNAGLVR